MTKNKSIKYNLSKKEWQLKEEQISSISKNESLVKVIYAGLCGSDMHKILSPSENEETITLGHEIVGTVENTSNKKFLNKKVAINPIINCGTCENCQQKMSQFCTNSINLGKNIDGGFSYYVKAPNKSLYILSNNFPTEAATLIDGAAVIVNALEKTKTKPKKVLIVGDGTIGALAIAVLNSLYKNISITLIGKNNKNFLEKIYSLSPVDNNYDLCIETVGRSQEDTLNLCIEKSSIGGTILVLGVYPSSYMLGFSARTAFYKELAIYGINSFVKHERRDDFQKAIDIIDKNSQLFLPLITHKVHLENFTSGVEKMKNKKEEPIIKINYFWN